MSEKKEEKKIGIDRTFNICTIISIIAGIILALYIGGKIIINPEAQINQNILYVIGILLIGGYIAPIIREHLPAVFKATVGNFLKNENSKNEIIEKLAEKLLEDQSFVSEITQKINKKIEDLREKENVEEQMMLQDSGKPMKDIQKDFWDNFIKNNKEKFLQFKDLKPNSTNTLVVPFGYPGIVYTLVTNKKRARVEFYITDLSDKAKNKRIFNELEKQKKAIEKEFGEELNWYNFDKNVTCKITCEKKFESVFDEKSKDKVFEFLIETFDKMYRIFNSRLDDLG